MMPTQDQIVGGLQLCISQLESENKVLRRALEMIKAREGQREIDATAEPCIWTEDENGLWTGPCGVAWQFNDAGPQANGCNFCLRCGRPVEPHPYIEPEGERYEH